MVQGTVVAVGTPQLVTNCQLVYQHAVGVGAPCSGNVTRPVHYWLLYSCSSCGCTGVEWSGPWDSRVYRILGCARLWLYIM